MNVEQYRILLKSMNDRSIIDKDLDFVYTMNCIMQDNIVGDYEVRNIFTVLDRFVYFVAEKIRSCNSIIKLSRKCEKCETTSSFPINLTNLVGSLESQIDKSYREIINHENYGFVCDIPTLAAEYDILEYSRRKNVKREELDFQIDNKAITFINAVRVGKTIIEFHNRSYSEKLAILQKIPAGPLKAMHEQYVNVIGALVNDIKLVELKCPGTINRKPCGDIIEKTFDIYNVNDMIKLVYADHSHESLMIDIYNLSSASNMAVLIPSMTPKELLELLEMGKKTESEPQQQDKREFDMLEQYRAQNGSRGMTESPSEF